MTDSKELHVRTGTPEDVDEVMALALMATEENAFLKVSPPRLLADIWAALNQDHGLMGVIGEPGAIEGVVLLRIGQMWYSDEVIVEEKAIFVHPDHRSAKGGRARRLCQFSKEVSDKLELPLVIGILSNQRTEGKVRMYQREFGHPAGAFFLYRATTGSPD